MAPDSRRGEFFVQFDESTLIFLGYESPQSAPDRAWAALVVKGDVAIRLVAEDGEDHWELLAALYGDAERCVLGYDKALDTIEEALRSQDRIGTADDSIPF